MIRFQTSRAVRFPLLLLASGALLGAGAASADESKTAGAASAGDSKAAAAKIAAAMNPGAGSSFSVEMHFQGKDGESGVLKRTVSGGKTRMDMSAQGHEFSTIQLDDADGTMYMVMPEQKMVMKQSTKKLAERLKGVDVGGKASAADSAAANQGKLEYLGQETIDGQAADKYRASYASGSGTMWVDPKSNLPLRMEAEGSRVDFRNYQFGPQPAERFAPPAGYEVRDLDEMMKNMPQGMGMGSMLGSMGGSMAGNLAGGFAGGLGSALGGSLGGPLGAMAGQFVGQKIGQAVGHKAAHAVTGP